MQTTSTLYKQLLAAEHEVRYRVLMDPNNTEYGMGRLISIQTSNQLFEDGSPNVGNAIAGQLDLKLTGFIKEPPKLGKIKIQSQLYSDDQASEWITNGVYFIDTREKDAVTGEITIQGYDAMRKGDQDIYKDGTYYEEWPKTDIEAVNFIAESYLGCTVDERTTELLTRGYEIPFPGYGSEAITARGLLQYIAGINGGNFIISPRGELRFIPLNHIPPKPGSLVDTNGDYIVFGRYRITVEET